MTHFPSFPLRNCALLSPPQFLTRVFQVNLILLLLLITSTANVSAAPAATIYVTAGAIGINNGDGCSIVEAIINANNDNTSGSSECTAGSGTDLIHGPGSVMSLTTTYNEDGQTALPTITESLQIRGFNGVLEREFTSEPFRLLRVGAGTLTLESLTVRGGDMNEGAAILVESEAGLVLTGNSSVRDSVAFFSGGGIYGEDDSTITINGSNVTNNHTAGNGGGIASAGGTVVVDFNSQVQDNGAGGNGGGIFVNNGGSLTIRLNGLIRRNNAVEQGGAVYTENTTLSIQHATIFDNEAGQDGSGLALSGGTATIERTAIDQNAATTSGGGIYVTNGAQVDIDRSTVSRNVASQGAGVYVQNATVSFLNSTVSGNDATGNGGGIATVDASLTLTNTTLSDNAAAEGGGLHVNIAVPFGNSVSLTRSIVSGNDSTIRGNEIASVNGDISISTDTNLFGDSSATNAQAFYNFIVGSNDITATSDGTDPTPLNGILGSLGTLCPRDSIGCSSTEYHNVVPSGPAVDAVATGPAIDQRGFSRPNDGDGNTSATEYDIGSVEYSFPTAITLGSPLAVTPTTGSGWVWVVALGMGIIVAGWRATQR